MHNKLCLYLTSLRYQREQEIGVLHLFGEYTGISYKSHHTSSPHRLTPTNFPPFPFPAVTISGRAAFGIAALFANACVMTWLPSTKIPSSIRWWSVNAEFWRC